MGRYFVFIDESGNPAFDKTQQQAGIGAENHLLFGATIIKEENCDSVKKLLEDTKRAIKKSKLHFTEISKHYDKLYALTEISEKESFTSFAVISNKNTIRASEYTPKSYSEFYNKNLLYLFERINYFLGSEHINPEDVSYYIEESNVFNLILFKNYIKTIRNNGRPRYLYQIKINNIHVHAKKDTDLFFLADMIASSIRQITSGHVISGRQLIESRYFNILLPHFYKKRRLLYQRRFKICS